jgi:hypothetical protein
MAEEAECSKQTVKNCRRNISLKEVFASPTHPFSKDIRIEERKE